MGVAVVSNMMNCNVVDQVPTKMQTDIATQMSVDSPQPPTTETTLGDLAASIVADAKVSPVKYLRRCVTGHDGE